MTISIIIPTYNGADFVRFAIESALNQTRKADEIIVSDDNSNDETLNICKEYGDKIKIFVNTKGPSGFVKGWINAINHSNSDFIAILHQDDMLFPTFLEEIEKAIIKYPDVKHFFVPCNYIDNEGNILNEPDYCDNKIHKYTGIEYVVAYQNIGRPNVIHIHRCPGVVTHRDIFKVCQYNEAAGHIADDDFFYRVGQFTDVVGILKTLASYRLHDKSETGHLNQIKLIKRLADDYIYQVKQWANSSFISGDTYNYFRKNAKQFSFELFILGFKYESEEMVSNGYNCIKELITYDIHQNYKRRLFIEFYSVCGYKVTSLIMNCIFHLPKSFLRRI